MAPKHRGEAAFLFQSLLILHAIATEQVQKDHRENPPEVQIALRPGMLACWLIAGRGRWPGSGRDLSQTQ